MWFIWFPISPDMCITIVATDELVIILSRGCEEVVMVQFHSDGMVWTAANCRWSNPMLWKSRSTRVNVIFHLCRFSCRRRQLTQSNKKSPVWRWSLCSVWVISCSLVPLSLITIISVIPKVTNRRGWDHSTLSSRRVRRHFSASGGREKPTVFRHFRTDEDDNIDNGVR